jgi:hypothetical protein
MGQHKVKEKNKKKMIFSIPGDNAHGVDVEVASETHDFDNMSPLDPDQREAYQKLTLQLARAKSLAFVFMNSPGGPPTILGEVYVQKVLARAELVVLSKIVEERLGVPAKEYVQRVADQVEKQMDLEQIANKLIITPDGVFKD